MNFYISAVSAAVISIVFITTLIGIDLPFSMVYKYFHSYQEAMKLAQYKNSARTTKALDYIHSLNEPAKEIPDSKSTQDIDVLIVVVTVSREKEPRSQKTGYLLQTASTMDKLMKTDKYFSKKFMFVCNVDETPIRHPDATELQNYLPFIQKGGKSNLGVNVTHIPKLQGGGLVDESRKQEIVDYAYCLNVSLLFNFRYALILEDDVIPHENLFEVLYHTLKYRLLEHKLDHDKRIMYKNFSFLKLYFPQRWQGYGFETDRILELVSIGTIGGAIFTIISSFFESESPRTRKGKSSAAAFLFLCGFLCFIITAKILGRVNIMEIRRLTPSLFKFGPSAECCSQAMLYRREVLPNIVKHLLINNSLNKDLAIYDFSHKYSTPGYQLEPNLFLHTGMHTSLSSGIKSPEEFLFDLSSLE